MKINLSITGLFLFTIFNQILNQISKIRSFMNFKKRYLQHPISISFSSITSDCSTTVSSFNLKAFPLSNGVNVLINQCSSVSKINNQVYLYSSIDGSLSNAGTGYYNANAFNNLVRYTSMFNPLLSSLFVVYDNLSCTTGGGNNYGPNCDGTKDSKLNFVKYVFTSNNPINYVSQTIYMNIFSQINLGSNNVIFIPTIENCPFNNNLQLFVGLEMNTNKIVENIFFQFVNLLKDPSQIFLDKRFVYTTTPTQRTDKNRHPFQNLNRVFYSSNPNTMFFFIIESDGLNLISFDYNDPNPTSTSEILDNTAAIIPPTPPVGNTFFMDYDSNSNSFAIFRITGSFPNYSGTLHFYPNGLNSVKITKPNIICGNSSIAIIKNLNPLFIVICGSINVFQISGNLFNPINSFNIPNNIQIFDLFFQSSTMDPWSGINIYATFANIFGGSIYSSNVAKITSCLLVLMADGRCVTSPSCPPGNRLFPLNTCCQNLYSQTQNICVNSCRTNEYLFNNICFNTCPNSTSPNYDDMNCYPVCPIVLNNKVCSTKCNIGQFIYNKICYATCPTVPAITLYTSLPDYNCYQSCPNFFYQNYCFNNCNQTVTYNFPYTFPLGNKCVNNPCSTNGTLLYDFNKTCLNSCPVKSSIYTNINNSTCTDCKTFNNFKLNSTCVDFCPYPYREDYINYECINCGMSNLFYFNGTCVYLCPLYYVRNYLAMNCVPCTTYSLVYFKGECVKYSSLSGVILVNIQLQAYDTCSNVKMYYLNGTCYQKCPSSYPLVDPFGNCVNLELNNLYYYNGLLTTQCPYYYLYNSTRYCYNCQSLNKSFYNNTCVTKCPSFMAPNANNICDTCDNIKLFSFNGTCLSNCPNNTVPIIKSNKKLCQNCTDIGNVFFNNSCIQSCPQYSKTESGICKMCSWDQWFYYNSTCLSSCPPFTIPNYDNWYCVDTNYTVDISSYTDYLNSDCKNLGCSNNGTCYIINNVAKCNCTSGYVGKFCNYDSKNLTNISNSLAKNLTVMNFKLALLSNNPTKSLDDITNLTNVINYNNSLINNIVVNSSISVSDLNSISQTILDYALSINDLPILHNPRNSILIYNVLNQIVSTLSSVDNFADETSLTTFLSVVDVAFTVNIMDKTIGNVGRFLQSNTTKNTTTNLTNNITTNSTKNTTTNSTKNITSNTTINTTTNSTKNITTNTTINNLIPNITLSSIYNQLNDMITYVMRSFQKSTIFYQSKFKNYEITLSNLTDISMTMIQINLTSNESTFNMNLCQQNFLMNYGLQNNNTILLAKIDWYPSIISNFTNNFSNTSAISLFLFTFNPFQILDPGVCDVTTPLLFNFPAINNISQYLPTNTLPLILNVGMNVSIDNQYDDFFNSRCYGVSIDENGLQYDLTVGMRRKLYFRTNTYQCLGIFTLDTTSCNFSSVFSSFNIDYVQCQCSGLKDVAYQLMQRTFNYSISSSNLDVVMCPSNGFNSFFHLNRGFYFCAGYILLLTMCLFFSGLCINRNVINNKFYEILRTDGKFEDERFIKPRKIVPIYENAKIKINALKLQDKDQLLNINCYDEIKDDYDDIYKMGKILKSDANTKKNNNLDDIKSEYTQENPDKIIAIKSEIEKNTDSILQGNEKIIDQNIAPTKEFIQIISVRDYFAVSHRDITDWDDRSFAQYFWDALSYQNLFYYAFFRYSLLTPYFIRIILLFIQLNFFFLLNCMMYTDDIIDHRLNYLSWNYFVYSICYESRKSLWAYLISLCFMPFFYIIVKPGYYEEEKLLYAMKQRDPNFLKETYSDFLSDMMCNYLLFFLFTFLLLIFSFYYLIEFSGVYYYSSLGWISGGFISFIYYLIGLDFFIPLTISLFKKIADLDKRFR